MNTAIEEEANIVKKIFILFANSNSYKLTQYEQKYAIYSVFVGPVKIFVQIDFQR